LAVCAGNIQIYTASGQVGSTFAWTVTGGLPATGSGNTLAVTWGSAGTGTLSIIQTSSTNCPSIATNQNIAINPNPIAPTIAPATATCAGSTVAYTATGQVGSTFAWTVTGGSPATGAGNTLAITWGNGVSGNISIIETSSAGCVSPASIRNITLNALPTALAITPITAVCAGNIQMYSITNPNVGSTFAWTVTGGLPATGAGNTLAITWGTAGIGKIDIVEANTQGCAGGISSQNITINAIPTAPIVSPTLAVCAGNIQIYTASGQVGSTFAWTVTGGLPATGSGNTLAVTWTTSGVGIISIIQTPTTGCASAPLSQNIAVNPLPTTQNTSTWGSPVCLNSTVNYTATATGSIVWSILPASRGTILSGQGTNNLGIQWIEIGSADLTLEETNLATGCKRINTKTININTAPTTPAIVGNTIVCQNGSGTFSVLNPNNYTVLWEVVSGGAINGASNTNSVNIDWTGTGTGSLKLTLSAGSCTASATQIVSIIAPPVVNFTPVTASVCLGGTTTHTAPDAPVGQTYEYTWTTNGGTILSGATAKVMQARWNIDNGTEYVRLAIKIVGTNCEKTSDIPGSPVDLGFVDVNPSPAPLVSGDALVCPDEVSVYQTPNVIGNTYTWTVVNGVIQSTSNNQVTIKWNSLAGVGTVKLTEKVTVTSCEKIAADFAVTISPLPALPTSPDRSVCNPPKTIDLNAVEASAVAYTWYDVAIGGLPVASSQIYSPTVTTTVSYWVSATNLAGCESLRKEVKIEVNPISAGLVITPTLVHADSCVAVGDSPSGRIALVLAGNNGPYTFLWSKIGNPTFTATTQNLTGLTKGDYRVIVTDAGGCTTTSGIYTILEQLKNVQNAQISYNGTVLVDDALIVTAQGVPISLKAEATNAVGFDWRGGTNAQVAITQTYTFTPTQTGTFSYTVMITNDRNCTAVRKVRVKVVELNVFVPNVFSPNSDNKNDKLQVYGNGIKSVTFKVYNRLGQVIFETNKWIEGNATDNIAGWDGYYDGKLQESGNYTWLLSVTYINETAVKDTGNVYLKY